MLRLRNLSLGLWLVDDETAALDLLHVVESDDSDVADGVCLLHLLDLLEYLARVGAPEHRQLPHCPIPSIVVPRRTVVLTVHVRVLHTKVEKKKSTIKPR